MILSLAQLLLPSFFSFSFLVIFPDLRCFQCRNWHDLEPRNLSLFLEVSHQRTFGEVFLFFRLFSCEHPNELNGYHGKALFTLINLALNKNSKLYEAILHQNHLMHYLILCPSFFGRIRHRDNGTHVLDTSWLHTFWLSFFSFSLAFHPHQVMAPLLETPLAQAKLYRVLRWIIARTLFSTTHAQPIYGA